MSTDMRKGFDTLYGEVRRGMVEIHWAKSLHLLQYESYTVEASTLGAGGGVIYHKRFERGMLTLPRFDQQTDNYQITWRELVLLIEREKLERIEPHKRYDISLNDSANCIRISLQSPR